MEILPNDTELLVDKIGGGNGAINDPLVPSLGNATIVIRVKVREKKVASLGRLRVLKAIATKISTRNLFEARTQPSAAVRRR
jgi:hypothetical protein